MTEKDPTIKTEENQNYLAYKNIGNEIPFLGRSNNRSEQSASAEFINRDKFNYIVGNIIKHPAFSFEDSGQPQEYDNQKMDELFESITELKKKVDSLHQDLEVPDRLETILAEDAQNYPFNNNYSDITARTAHGLFRGNGANCIGFSETCCIMLNLYGYKPVPVLSRLNKSGAACHYVTCFENDDGKIEILDPERRRSCDEVEKQYSLTAYQGSLRYATPTQEFSKIKIGGPNGIGPAFDEYFGDKQDEVVKPIALMMRKLEKESDDIDMYEKETTTSTRINLKANSMSSRKKELLDNVISDTLRPIYEKSLALMPGNEV